MYDDPFGFHRRGLRDALKSGVLRRVVTGVYVRADMLAALPRYGRRRGVAQLRELVPLADPRSESPRESWLRIEIHDAGLPIPNLQYGRGGCAGPRPPD